MPLELFIVRHAIAAQRGPEWPDDSERPLTERGMSRFKKSVAGLAALGVKIDLVLTSPLVRAKQTADCLAAGLPSKPAVTVIDALAPGHAPADTMEQVAREAHGQSRIAIVGHEPDLGELTAFLLETPRAIPFKKGGVGCVDLDTRTSRHGTLVWLATPKMLRKLGK